MQSALYLTSSTADKREYYQEQIDDIDIEIHSSKYVFLFTQLVSTPSDKQLGVVSKELKIKHKQVDWIMN